MRRARRHLGKTMKHPFMRRPDMRDFYLLHIWSAFVTTQTCNLELQGARPPVLLGIPSFPGPVLPGW